MAIGIFGGTFNPPHRGHLQAAVAAIRTLDITALYVIPTGEPPHKSLPEGTPNGADRYRMTRLLFAEEKQVTVLDLELRRAGPSYTIDTVLEVQQMHPQEEIYLLLGTDMFQGLENWRQAERLLQIVTPAVFARAGGQASEITAFAKRLQVRYGVQSRLIDHEILETSSTDLRANFSSRTGRNLVGDSVYAELIAQRHYGAQPDLEWLREQVNAMLSPNRVAHVRGTEEEAARLAKWWGADETEARMAAILHDVTKALGSSEQLQFCVKHGILMDGTMKQSAKLLHAKTGAYLAKEKYGASSAVVDAIAYHTTGRNGMSLLEQIIYMADYIEPTRNFPEVCALRELAYIDLESALLQGLELTLTDLAEQGLKPHPDTEAAIKWLNEKARVKRVGI